MSLKLEEIQPEDQYQRDVDHKQTDYSRGVIVAVALAVLTAIEYVIGIMDSLPLFSTNLIPLIVVALIKAGVIVNYYMHISRLWSEEEH